MTSFSIPCPRSTCFTGKLTRLFSLDSTHYPLSPYSSSISTNTWSLRRDTVTIGKLKLNEEESRERVLHSSHPPSANPSNIQFATYSWQALDLAPLPWSSSETKKSHLHLYPRAARAREAKTNQTSRPADCGACLSLSSCLSQADLEGLDAVV